MHQHNAEYSYPLQDSSQDKKPEYKKLALILAVIAVCATLMSFVLGFDWLIWMEWFMGGFLIIFGSFKLIGYEDFITVFPTYDPIAKRFQYYNYAYPFIELFLGFLFVSNLAPIFRNSVALLIFSIGAYGIMQKISSNSHDIKCVCLGNVIKLPLSTVSLLEDVLMAVGAAIMLVSIFIF